jgi:two-component system, OmpR family, response regulator VicR
VTGNQKRTPQALDSRFDQENFMKAEKVLTSGEVGKLCNVNFRTVLRWIERGELSAYKLPGRGDSRIRIDDFLDFLVAHQMPIPEALRPDERKVLVVDDEAHMARSIRRVLRREEYDVKIASDGFRAGTYLGTFAPSVVTLDLQMPGLSGFDVLSFIRQTSGLEKVRILVVSGLDEQRLKQTLSAGADDYLAKPFRNEDLVAKVNSLMTNESRSAAAVCKADSLPAEWR